MSLQTCQNCLHITQISLESRQKAYGHNDGTKEKIIRDQAEN